MIVRYRGTVTDSLETVVGAPPALVLAGACTQVAWRSTPPDLAPARVAAAQLGVPAGLLDAVAGLREDDPGEWDAYRDVIAPVLTAAMGSEPLRAAASHPNMVGVLEVVPMALLPKVEVIAWDERERSEVLLVNCDTPNAAATRYGPQPAVIQTCDLEGRGAHDPADRYLFALAWCNPFDIAACVIAAAIDDRRRANA